MEFVLRKNDWKGGWENDHEAALFNSLKKEVMELEDAIFQVNTSGPQSKKYGLVIKEAVDTANFALMIADVVSRKQAELNTEKEKDG